MQVGPKLTPAENAALEFVHALARRDQGAADTMSSGERQSTLSCEEMQHAFESNVPDDRGPVGGYPLLNPGRRLRLLQAGQTGNGLTDGFPERSSALKRLNVS